jgi:hypothetical protein
MNQQDDISGRRGSTALPERPCGVTSCASADKPEICAGCGVGKDELMAKILHVKIEADRRHFSERERLVLGWLLTIYARLGISDVLIARLEDLGNLVGLSRSNVHPIVERLQLYGVLRVSEVVGGKRYQVEMDTRQWQVTPRVSREDLESALSTITELNGFETTFFRRCRTTGDWSVRDANGQPVLAAVPKENGTVSETATEHGTRAAA